MFLPVVVSAQLTDRLWLGGYNEFPGVAGYGHCMIRLQGDTVAVSPETLAFNFESTAAVATDTSGQLLFYSNGCSIANRLHQVMPNGAGLNPGEVADQVCPDPGYIVPQGAMVLPLPDHPEQYYLFHLGGAYDPVRKLKTGPLRFSIVDMSLDGGLGDVVSKNNVILTGTDISGFTAIRHANGRDWWIIAPAVADQYWFTFLLSPSGLSSKPVQPVEFLLPACEKSGALTASPDGTYIAKWGECKVLEVTFDRCTGKIEHSLEISTPTRWIPGGGVAYAPSGRYLYATSHNVLFRADRESADIQFDTLRFSYDPFLLSPYFVRGNSFHYLTNGPDGRIYGNLPSRARQLHVIDNPEAASNEELVFLPRQVKLPVPNVRTMPYFPNYRLFDVPGSACDTLSIDTPTAVEEVPDVCAATIGLFPNPATHELYLRLNGCDLQRVRVMNALGFEVKTAPVVATDGNTMRIDVSALPAGLYVAGIQMRNGRWLSRKFMVVR